MAADVGLRATAGVGAEKIGAKIRGASMEKIPFLLIVGEQGAAAGTVAVRPRVGAEEKMPLAAFAERAKAEVAQRSMGVVTSACGRPVRGTIPYGSELELQT